MRFFRHLANFSGMLNFLKYAKNRCALFLHSGFLKYAKKPLRSIFALRIYETFRSAEFFLLLTKKSEMIQICFLLKSPAGLAETAALSEKDKAI